MNTKMNFLAKAPNKFFPKGNKLESTSNTSRDHPCQNGNLPQAKDAIGVNKEFEKLSCPEEKKEERRDSTPNETEISSEVQTDKATRIAEMINELNEMVRCRDLEIDSFRSEVKKLNETVQDLKRENEVLRNKRIKEHYYKKKREAFTKGRSMSKEDTQDPSSTWYTYEDRIEKSKEEKIGMARVLNDANETIRKRDEEVCRFESEIEDLKKQLRETDERSSDPQTTQNLQDQIEVLTLRLSELASVRLLQNNPHIADLSDTDRPTKLAERFSELYDNEWTDAFDELCELRGIDETNGIAAMLDLLQIVDTIQINYPDEDYKTVHDLKRKYRKALEEEGELSKAIGRKISIDNGIDPDSSRNVFEYIKSCVKICWYMQILEPPVYIDFQSAEENMDLDLGVFRPYTKSGDKLEFIVWPPLFLYKDGPLLCKGVAQGIS